MHMKTNRDIKNALYEQVARIAKAAASPKRLELLELLCQAPKVVDVLAREAGISMKLASAHLKALKTAKLVESERQGKNIVYRLASDDVARFWVQLRLLAEDRLFELQEAIQEMRAATHEWIGTDREALLRKAQSGEIVVIDVRPASEFEAGHLPYALSMPLGEIKERLSQLPKRKTIVAYCRGPFCLMSTDAVALLRAEGFEALQLREGIAEWRCTEKP